jgi:hypothetical protein
MWRCSVALLFCSVRLVDGQPAAGTCPQLTHDTTIAKISPADRVLRFDGGYVAIVNEIRLDSDGSPVAYHPANGGTTHLCNGLDPIINGRRITDKNPSSPCFQAVRYAMAADWKRASSPTFCIYGFFAPGTADARFRSCNLWGGSFGRGEIPLQAANDPAPGFFVSTTAARSPGSGAEDRPSTYIDADRTPYAVVPGSLVSRNVLRKGGIAWAWNPQSDRASSGVIGDSQSKFGEISVAFAQQLEKGVITPIKPRDLESGGAVPWPYQREQNGNVRLRSSPRGPAVFVYFSAAPDPALSNYEAASIAAAARTLVQRFGGPDALKRCLRPLVTAR